MTVKELIEQLEKMPAEAKACIYDVGVFSNDLEQIDYAEVRGIEEISQDIYLDENEVPLVNNIVGIFQ